MSTETTPPKFPLTSMDVAEEKRRQLKQLFPEAFTEARDTKTGELEHSVDWEKLRASLGEVLEREGERFGLSWPGKSALLKVIQQPSVGTLKPSREESVNFDQTENLFIEGDNLEVLKLLQKSYFGKVKMIYIDPPYNTGNEFVYPDNFTETLETYLQYTGMVDAQGRKFSTNAATEGRFHSKWLNMMYPRLFLAKNLLKEDGVIFISIDDNEITNLTALCNEIFGEENHVATLTIINNMKGRNDKANVATCHEYLLAFGMPSFMSNGLPLSEEKLAEYKHSDENGFKYALRDLRKRGRPDRREDRPNMFFPIFYDKDSGSCALSRNKDTDIEIVPKRGDGSDGRWRWGLERVKRNLCYLHPKYSERKERWDIEHRVYLDLSVMADADDGDEEADNDDQEFLRTSKPKSFWWGGDLSTDVANREFKKLISDINPDYPKSPYFIEDLIRMGTNSEDTVIDFFSGYATTAHAVQNLNKEDGGNRKFIMVQLPEPCDEKSEAFKAGYKTIADIGKERIRRVIQKIEKEHDGELDFDKGDKPQDLGFKVFKLSESNFKLWEGNETDPEKLKDQLEMHINHLDPKATPEDILYELLLKAGFPLTTKVEKISISDKSAYSIAEGALIICLDDNLTKEAIQAIAALKPVQCICLDAAFHENDQLKTNAVQTMEAAKVQFRTV